MAVSACETVGRNLFWPNKEIPPMLMKGFDSLVLVTLFAACLSQTVSEEGGLDEQDRFEYAAIGMGLGCTK